MKGEIEFSVKCGEMRLTSPNLFNVRVSTLSQDQRSCLSLINRPRVDKKKKAFFSRQESHCLTSSNTFSVGVSAGNLG